MASSGPTWASVRPVLNSAFAQKAAFRPAAGKREPVFPELLAGPLPKARALVGANCASRAYSIYLSITGDLGRPPLSPFLQEKRGREKMQPKHPAEMLFSEVLSFFHSSSPWPVTLASFQRKNSSELFRSSGNRPPGVNPSAAQLCDLLKLSLSEPQFTHL